MVEDYACNENVIEWIRNDSVATVTLSQGRHITRIRKLAATHPEDVQITAENMDGSICAHIPVKYIKFNPPVKLDEEEKEKRRENIKRAMLKRH